MDPILELSEIRKRFLGVTALDGVDFDLLPGEVHALMGENGAGKSTLLKVATGVYPPDSGSIRLAGSVISPHSPADAVRHGISTVYQEVNLVPNLSVAENICLGREPRGPFGIRWRALTGKAREAVARVGLDVDVSRPLGGCSIAVQQMVAIARALDVSCKVLVLDEPTSSLDAREVEQLFTVIRRLRAEGLGIVFVTHFLDQVYEVCDRITILRNGKKVGTWKAADLDKRELVSQMIGRDAAELERPAASLATTGDVICEGENLTQRGAIEGLTFAVRSGEVLGLAGLLGSGRTESMRLMFGLDSPDSGRISVDQNPANLTPRRAIRAGFGFCSEDRKAEGIFPELTIRENILLALQAKRGWLRPLSARAQRELATELSNRLRVQPPDIERPIQFLSGGNQQKALLARWLAIEPRLLLLDEPTRGIDVGAKFEIMSLVDRLRSEGKSFVFVSSELPEVVRTANRVIVLRDRKVAGSMDSDISEQKIIDVIAGESR